MSDGSTSTTGFNWSVEGGGAVSVSGLYTAPSASQETPATITATKSSKKGTATVNQIVDPATIVTRGPIAGKVGGSTTGFTTMFTATNSTETDYNFVVTPTAAGSVNASGVFSLNANASGTVTVKATHKTQTSVTATTSFTGVVAKASIQSKGPITTQYVGGSSIPFSTLFTLTNSVADDYTITVSPTANGAYSGGNIVLTNNASGSTVVMAVHKSQGNASDSCTISNVTPKATLTAKALTGKVGGDVIPFADMFTSNKPASEFNYVLTPTGDVGTINTTTGALTLNLAPTDELMSVKATHKTQTSVTATATITATPKLTGLVLSSVTNTTVTGSPTAPAASDTITITDSGVAGVARVDGVPQGAITGALMYDVEGTDSSLMTVDLTSNVLTITLSAPITSEDTKVTIRTNPGSDIFRTYIVKSGA